MKFGSIIATLAFIGLTATPTLADSCRDKVDSVDKQARDKATLSISHASGGQSTAAQREASKTDKPPMAANGGASQGDSANQAQVAINEARVALGKGDKAGCESAVAKAKAELAK